MVKLLFINFVFSPWMQGLILKSLNCWATARGYCARCKGMPEGCLSSVADRLNCCRWWCGDLLEYATHRSYYTLTMRRRRRKRLIMWQEPNYWFYNLGPKSRRAQPNNLGVTETPNLTLHWVPISFHGIPSCKFTKLTSRKSRPGEVVWCY